MLQIEELQPEPEEVRRTRRMSFIKFYSENEQFKKSVIFQGVVDIREMQGNIYIESKTHYEWHENYNLIKDKKMFIEWIRKAVSRLNSFARSSKTKFSILIQVLIEMVNSVLRSIELSEERLSKVKTIIEETISELLKNEGDSPAKNSNLSTLSQTTIELVNGVVETLGRKNSRRERIYSLSEVTIDEEQCEELNRSIARTLSSGIDACIKDESSIEIGLDDGEFESKKEVKEDNSELLPDDPGFTWPEIYIDEAPKIDYELKLSKVISKDLTIPTVGFSDEYKAKVLERINTNIGVAIRMIVFSKDFIDTHFVSLYEENLLKNFISKVDSLLEKFNSSFSNYLRNSQYPQSIKRAELSDLEYSIYHHFKHFRVALDHNVVKMLFSLVHQLQEKMVFFSTKIISDLEKIRALSDEKLNLVKSILKEGDFSGKLDVFDFLPVSLKAFLKKKLGIAKNHKPVSEDILDFFQYYLIKLPATSPFNFHAMSVLSSRSRKEYFLILDVSNC